MKKLIAILLVTASIPLLWACDSESDKQEQTEQETTEITETVAAETSEAVDEEYEKQLFFDLYLAATMEYMDSIEEKTKPLYEEIEELETERAELTREYNRKRAQAMSSPASETRQLELNALARSFESANMSINNQIKQIRAELNRLYAEADDPDYMEVLRILAKDNHMPLSEALEKYNKYSGSEEK
ncbi:MAG: hypothetical protein E7668_05455 [Ruminococcaceae bacterium]|nr:hypothetical protein [Oscillospiraceae bacterium]